MEGAKSLVVSVGSEQTCILLYVQSLKVVSEQIALTSLS